MVIAFSLAGPVWGQGLVPRLGDQEIRQVLRLKVGSSKVLKIPFAVTRISVANPEVADIVLISEREIYVNGLGPGVTNLSLWGRGRFTSTTVTVEADLTLLKEKLAQILPRERIAVEAAGDSIVLSGEVSGVAAQETALALARAFLRESSLREQATGGTAAPGAQTQTPATGGAAAGGAQAPAASGGQKGFKESRVINLMHIGGVQQVLVEVRMAEISRNVLNHLGVNFQLLQRGGDSFGISQINSLTTVTDFVRTFAGMAWTNNLSTNIAQLGGFRTGSVLWTLFFDALKQQGLGKLLAEPNLMATSGQEATFLAGGEFPIPVPQALGVISIEFKKFGVGLKFTPTVLDGGRISLKIQPEVSELDFTAGVAFSSQGFLVPGIRLRSTSTQVEVKDGQTLAISGLILDSQRNIVNKFPVLGDIPVLGTLFRSAQWQKQESELVVLVTPHLVRPMSTRAARLPTDRYVEPTEFEFYLLGKTEGRGKQKTAPPAPGANQGTLPSGFGRQAVD
jgi:pilus assembly protein CpaC